MKRGSNAEKEAIEESATWSTKMHLVFALLHS